MKRYIFIVAGSFLLSLLLCNHASAAGYIKGQLSDGTLTYAGITVTFFNSLNAEIISETTSTEGGDFLSGPLPAGQYKIHFYYKGTGDKDDISEDECFDIFLANSGTPENVFDTARIVAVQDNKETDLGFVSFPGGKSTSCGPVLCAVWNGTISGVITDSSNNPIPGIKVSFKDPVNAFPEYKSRTPLTTDTDGYYILNSVLCDPSETKIRFYDPSGVYTPKYNGSNSDIFSEGATTNFREENVEINVVLTLSPPAQQVAAIIEEIQTILPPQDAQPLITSLQQGQNLLEDSNPNNDQGACGVLTGTTNKLEDLVASGALLQEEADALAASIGAIKTDLGCKK